MRKRNQGLTMAEKIEAHRNRAKKRSIVTQLGPTFFEPHEEEGSIFMLRRTNLERNDGRTLNIVD